MVGYDRNDDTSSSQLDLSEFLLLDVAFSKGIVVECDDDDTLSTQLGLEVLDVAYLKENFAVMVQCSLMKG